MHQLEKRMQELTFDVKQLYSKLVDFQVEYAMRINNPSSEYPKTTENSHTSDKRRLKRIKVAVDKDNSTCQIV